MFMASCPVRAVTTGVASWRTLRRGRAVRGMPAQSIVVAGDVPSVVVGLALTGRDPPARRCRRDLGRADGISVGLAAVILTAACTLALTRRRRHRRSQRRCRVRCPPTTVGGAWTVGAGSTVGGAWTVGGTLDRWRCLHRWRWLHCWRCLDGRSWCRPGCRWRRLRHQRIGRRRPPPCRWCRGAQREWRRRESWPVAAWANRRGDWSFGSAVVAPLVVGARKAPSAASASAPSSEQRAGIAPGAGLVAGV